MKTYPNFTVAYVDLLKSVYQTPEHEASPRGMKVKERLGHSFRIADIRDRLPYVPHREFSISYFVAEMVWYLSGNNSTDWISNYSSFWRHISDDGTTANSAYGARIFKQHPYQAAGDPAWTQWEYVKQELKKDPDSRRAVIHIRMPQDSALAQKDVPCTLTLQFFIRDAALHQVASMRSSDLILGLAYDVPAFTIFQELLALELGVECGSYTHMSNSLHIYERHYAMVERIINDPWVKEFPHRCKPMTALKTLPPLKLLMLADEAFRSSDTEGLLADVNAITSPFPGVEHDELGVYWRDWVLILAGHRAGKLELNQLRDELMARVSFSGFGVFKK